jgi:hypothetical protein
MIARAAQNESRQTALRLQRARVDAQMSGVQGQMGFKGTVSQIVNALPGGGAAAGLWNRFAPLGMSIGVPAAGLAGAGYAAKYAVDKSSELVHQSARTGLTIPQLQRVEYATGAARGNPEDVLRVIEDLRKNQSNALAGMVESQKAFARLGITMAELKRLQPDELFYKLAKAFKEGKVDFGALLTVAEEGAKNVFPAMKEGIADFAAEYDKTGKQIQQASTGIIESLSEVGGILNKWLTDVKTTAQNALIKTIGEKLGWTLMQVSAVQSILGFDKAANATFKTGLKAIDPDFSKSLAETDRLEQRLTGAQLNKTNEARQKSLVEATEKAHERSGRSMPQADALARIGLYVGGSTFGRQDKQVRKLEEIKHELSKVNTNLTRK